MRILPAIAGYCSRFTIEKPAIARTLNLGNFRAIGLNPRWTHPFLSNYPGAIHSIIQIRPRQNSWALQGIEKILPPKQMRRPLLFILLLCSQVTVQ